MTADPRGDILEILTEAKGSMDLEDYIELLEQLSEEISDYLKDAE